MLSVPELPEVETVRRGLARLITGKVFGEAEVINGATIAYPGEDEFKSRLTGRAVEAVSRRGKYLVLHLETGLQLIFHLRMTGVITSYDCRPGAGKHTRVLLPFQDGTGLSFHDQRKFGRIWLLQAGEEKCTGLCRLGPDWWEEVSPEVFMESMAKHPQGGIKGFLLNQGIMAGLGNIYVDESLFMAGINPCRRVSTISEQDGAELYQSVISTLTDGIKHGGTSIRDYRNAAGEEGGFQNRLQVYGRQGERCFRCGENICKTVLVGRGTHYCPGCQR